MSTIQFMPSNQGSNPEMPVEAVIGGEIREREREREKSESPNLFTKRIRNSLNPYLEFTMVGKRSP